MYYLWYFFSLDLSLFRFWDFLLLLIRREAPREKERDKERDKERENSISETFSFPGEEDFQGERSKNERLFLFLRAFDENTEREREQREREQESYFL